MLVHSEPMFIGECFAIYNHIVEESLAKPVDLVYRGENCSKGTKEVGSRNIFRVISEILLGTKSETSLQHKFHKDLVMSVKGTFCENKRLYRYPRFLPSINDIDISAKNVEFVQNKFAAMQGRSLLRSEAINAVLRSSGEKLSVYGSDSILDISANTGFIMRVPSVGYMSDGSIRCSRCGSIKGVIRRYCPSCDSDECAVCTSCEGLGEARECKELFLFPVYSKRQAESKQRDIVASLDFELTQPQHDASIAVSSFVEKNAERECLVWAVCGAGKTEVVFKAIEDAVRLEKHVLYAIPRRDVVVELAERLKKAFGSLKIAVLYGGGPPYEGEPDVVLSTTHQVLRFNNFFDLAIIDEVDAFPYNGSDMLVAGVRRAIKKNAQLIYMTATPDRALKKKAVEGELALVTIPARHHSRPLPVPVLLAESIPESGKLPLGSLPIRIREFISGSLSEGYPLFVFSPTVSLVNSYYDLLSREFCDASITFCYSHDPDRDAKREGLRSGKYDIVVTTSIMERGITIPKCDVLVMNADYSNIFDERALVQMAGRAGRLAVRPTGSVLFVGTKISAEMKQAVEDIEYMNGIALSKGYIDMGGS